MIASNTSFFLIMDRNTIFYLSIEEVFRGFASLRFDNVVFTSILEVACRLVNKMTSLCTCVQSQTFRMGTIAILA